MTTTGGNPKAEQRDQPHSDDPLAAEFRIVLGRLTRRLRIEHGMGLTRAAVLYRLERSGTHSTGELARAENVRPQSMSQTLSELEADGMIHRRPDEKDLRRTMVELTDHGREAIRAEREFREGWLSNALAEQFSDEERALFKQAVTLMGRLAEM